MVGVMSTQRIIAEIERRVALCKSTYKQTDNFFAHELAHAEKSVLYDLRSFILALPPDDLATELADAKAENVALWRVADAAKADLDSDRKSNARLFSMTDTEWVQSLGDGERKTLDALAAVPPRDVKETK